MCKGLAFKGPLTASVMCEYYTFKGALPPSSTCKLRKASNQLLCLNKLWVKISSKSSEKTLPNKSKYLYQMITSYTNDTFLPNYDF